jgi:HB1, ASXL, restriction endonuclease HTH domain
MPIRFVIIVNFVAEYSLKTSRDLLLSIIREKMSGAGIKASHTDYNGAAQVRRVLTPQQGRLPMFILINCLFSILKTYSYYQIVFFSLQSQTKQRTQTRGTAHLAAGVHLLPSGGIFKSAAVEVLRREQRLMATGEICKLALEWGLLKCSGKTPEATMASSLYGDIKKNHGASLFFRPRGGMFGLKEWIEQGLFPPSAEALIAPIAQQDSDGSAQSSQKMKRQRKSATSSTSKPSKRQHGDAAPPPPAAVAVAETKNLNGQATQINSKYTNLLVDPQPHALQNISMQHSNNKIVESKSPASAGALTAAQPRQRLLTNESNEAAIGTTSTTQVYINSSISGKSTTLNGAAAHAVTQQERVRLALTEQENKVLAVEHKWGRLHPRAGQAHLLLYRACKQQSLRFPLVESRAQTALTR